MPEEYAAFVDDAAIFPPGNAPVGRALAEHQAFRAGQYAGLVGTFLVDDVRLPELLELGRDEGAAEPLHVSVVVTGGAGGIEPVVRWTEARLGVRLHAVEVALRDRGDLDDLAGGVRRIAAAARAAGDPVVYVEPPLLQGVVGSHGWLSALDEVAAADLRLKLRTGGLEPEHFPPSGTVATAIDAALDRELVFKCTAGLHSAVRHRATTTGAEHQGFLNLLLATRAALDGTGAAEVIDTLEELDEQVVLGRLREVGPTGLREARTWFASFGCCGVHDPLAQLQRLGLVGS